MVRPGSLLAVGLALAGVVGAGAATPARAAEANTPAAVANARAAVANTPAHAAQAAKTCPAQRLLAQPPFPPTNVDLFTPETYAQAPPSVPAPPRIITEERLRAELVKALLPRAERQPGVVVRGLLVFDDPQIEEFVPDPVLRAALATLVGGPSEVSIETIRSGFYAEVVFSPDAIPGAIANVTGPPPRILFEEKYRYENISLLGAVLSHETLHQDPAISAMEEYIAGALDGGYYGQVLLEQPKLATGGTELTRFYNTKLLALLNTRDAKGRQSLTADRGNVFPGGKPLANFRSLYPANLGPDTPGNTDLDAYLSAMTKTRQRDANFDQATADLLDARYLWASAEGRLRVAKLLQLDLPTGCPPWPAQVPPQRPTDDGRSDDAELCVAAWSAGLPGSWSSCPPQANRSARTGTRPNDAASTGRPLAYRPRAAD